MLDVWLLQDLDDFRDYEPLVIDTQDGQFHQSLPSHLSGPSSSGTSSPSLQAPSTPSSIHSATWGSSNIHRRGVKVGYSIHSMHAIILRCEIWYISRHITVNTSTGWSTAYIMPICPQRGTFLPLFPFENLQWQGCIVTRNFYIHRSMLCHDNNLGSLDKLLLWYSARYVGMCMI